MDAGNIFFRHLPWCLLLLSLSSALPVAAVSTEPEFDNRPIVDRQMLQQVTDAVVAVVADYFGADPSTLSAETDLVEQLFADLMDVSEVIKLALEQEQREAETIPGDLITIRQIAKFVAHADYKVMALEIRGAWGPKKSKVKEEVFIQRIFFGTNREPTGKREPGEMYGGGRSKDPKIHYGTALISIPKNHVRGKLEQPMNFGFFQLDADPKKHFVLKTIATLEWDDFIGQINSDLKPREGESGTAEDVLIFVHGFNVPFKQAALRTGQIAFDLRFQGAPILFSWPSRGGVFSYVSDREAVEWSVSYIERFLTDVVANTKARRYHLIAHSMGNQGVIPALYQIALRNKFGHKGMFENIILAAPDFDARKFTEQIAPEVSSLAKHWTIYASEKDAALKASKLLRMDTSHRLGQPLAVVDGMDTIDASGFEVSPWNLDENHSYFTTKNRVISDLKSILKGLSPEPRGLLRKLLGGKIYWRISEQ